MARVYGIYGHLPWIVVGPGESFGLAELPVRLILFEPRAEACEVLRRKITGAEVVEAACGDSSGEADWWDYNIGLSSSLHKVTDEARRAWDIPLELEGFRRVRTIRLSEFCMAEKLDHLACLLTDAQGMDLTILRDMRPWLERKAIECVVHECEDGYRHYDGPDNSLEASTAFMRSMGYHFIERLPAPEPACDLLWRAHG